MSNAEKVFTQFEDNQPVIRVNNRINCYIKFRMAKKLQSSVILKPYAKKSEVIEQTKCECTLDEMIDFY